MRLRMPMTEITDTGMNDATFRYDHTCSMVVPLIFAGGSMRARL